jgi:hypothetical protein
MTWSPEQWSFIEELVVSKGLRRNADRGVLPGWVLNCSATAECIFAGRRGMIGKIPSDGQICFRSLRRTESVDYHKKTMIVCCLWSHRLPSKKTLWENSLFTVKMACGTFKAK